VTRNDAMKSKNYRLNVLQNRKKTLKP